jgi:hypothetical protein
VNSGSGWTTARCTKRTRSTDFQSVGIEYFIRNEGDVRRKVTMQQQTQETPHVGSFVASHSYGIIRSVCIRPRRIFGWIKAYFRVDNDKLSNPYKRKSFLALECELQGLDVEA